MGQFNFTLHWRSVRTEKTWHDHSLGVITSLDTKYAIAPPLTWLPSSPAHCLRVAFLNFDISCLHHWRFVITDKSVDKNSNFNSSQLVKCLDSKDPWVWKPLLQLSDHVNVKIAELYWRAPGHDHDCVTCLKLSDHSLNILKAHHHNNTRAAPALEIVAILDRFIFWAVPVWSDRIVSFTFNLADII